VQQKRPNQEPPIDLIEQFYKENVDLKAILNARKAKKEVTSGLEPYTGEFGPAQKKHLLNRTMVGMAKRHMDDLEGLTLDEAIDLIFTPEELGEPVNNYFFEITNEQWNEKYGRDDVGPGEPFVFRKSVEFNGNREIDSNERNETINYFIRDRIYNQQTSIHWKLFLFLHNLIPVPSLINYKAHFKYTKLIFDSCFRDYRETIYNITVDPSMLDYLNLGLSKKETPDENYAREVQELFTVGKRPFSKYTEEDVREVARALVGWQIDRNSLDSKGLPKAYFNPSNHDTGDKFFSEFYGNKIIKGREGEDGAKELDDVIEMIFNTEESAIFLSRRLYQFFVYPEVSDQVELNIIKPMAKIMRDNNFSLTEPLKFLLKSEHFYDTSFFNSMIKSPLDFAYGFLKEFDLFNGDIQNYQQQQNEDNKDIPEWLNNPLTRKYYFFQQILWMTGRMGMQISNPPSVSGWPAYYQAPVYDLFWINSMTIQYRFSFAQNMTNFGFGFPNGGFHISDNKADYILAYQSVDNLDSLISEISIRFLGKDISSIASDRIKQSVLDGADESHWQELINEFRNNPTPNNLQNIRFRAQNLMSGLVKLGEFNLF